MACRTYLILFNTPEMSSSSSTRRSVAAPKGVGFRARMAEGRRRAYERTDDARTMVRITRIPRITGTLDAPRFVLLQSSTGKLGLIGAGVTQEKLSADPGAEFADLDHETNKWLPGINWSATQLSMFTATMNKEGGKLRASIVMMGPSILGHIDAANERLATSGKYTLVALTAAELIDVLDADNARWAQLDAWRHDTFAPTVAADGSTVDLTPDQKVACKKACDEYVAANGLEPKLLSDAKYFAAVLLATRDIAVPDGDTDYSVEFPLSSNAGSEGQRTLTIDREFVHGFFAMTTIPPTPALDPEFPVLTSPHGVKAGDDPCSVREPSPGPCASAGPCAGAGGPARMSYAGALTASVA